MLSPQAQAGSIPDSMSIATYSRLLYRVCDRVTEWLIYFAILFGPWAFGTTQPWSIRVMNGAGFALGLLLLAKVLVRSMGFRPLRWIRFCGNGESSRWVKGERRFTWMLGVGTFCILLYCLISAWNARAIYHPEQWRFEYRNAIPWLPHSYDQESSWSKFWEYLGLAGLFWALRDWLLAATPEETERFEAEGFFNQGGSRLPVRLRRLFWVLTFNGAALAMEGLMQRVDGGNKLLWLVIPRFNQTAESQFGPYAYRSNAAQYFNMLWPAVLGFWWASTSPSRRHKTPENIERRRQFSVLLPCILLIAICPLVSTTRGGAIVLVINLVLATGIMVAAQWRSGWRAKFLILTFVSAVILGGAILGWKALAPRMERIHQGYNEREALYLAGQYMARDNPVFGTGPGTFDTMYQLYRRSEEDIWQAYLHNDWLETLITFGRVGAAPIFLAGILVLSHWFWCGGIYGNRYFVMLLWVSIIGCLIHAWFDFPLQVHSVLTLFLVLCAVLSCLSRRLATV